MPRYRIIKEVPDRLNYSNGSIFFQDYHAGGDEWVWFVRRQIVHNHHTHLCTGKWRTGLDAARKEGIEVEKDSDADRVFRSLVLKGYATKIAD